MWWKLLVWTARAAGCLLLWALIEVLFDAARCLLGYGRGSRGGGRSHTGRGRDNRIG